MGRTLSNRAINSPRFILTVITLITIVASIGFKNVWLLTSYKAMFDSDDPLLIAMNQNEVTFSKSDWITIAVANPGGTVFDRDVLKAVELITDAAWSTPYSLRVDSLVNYQYTQGTEDELIVESLLEDVTSLTDKDIQVAAEKLKTLPEIQGFYLGEDLTTTVINITFELPENPVTEAPEITDFVNAMISDVKSQHPNLEYYVSGTVANAAAFTDAIFLDMGSLIPLSYVIMIGLMLVMTRSIAATVITLTVVTFSSTLAMGVKCWFDGSINAINMFAPMMIMTIAVADCIHVLTSFLAYYRDGEIKSDALRHAMKDNARPVFLTSLTTIIGFLSVNFHESPVYRESGSIIAFGVLMAYFLTFTMVPALVMLLPFKNLSAESKPKQWLESMAGLVVRKHKTVLFIGVVSSILLIAVGVPRNEINEDFNAYLDDSFPYRTANDYLNAHVTGTHRLMYALDSGQANGVHDPVFLADVDQFVQWLRVQPEIAHVSSYTDIVRRLNQAMNNNDDSFYAIPESLDLSSQYSFLYEMSLPYGQGLTNIVSFDKSKTLIMATAWTTDAKTILGLNERAENWLRENTRPTMHAHGAGLDLMFNKMAMQNVPSMVYGSVLCLLLVSLILLFVFRSWYLGLVSIITNVFPALLAFGVWGFVSGRIGIGVSSVAILTFGLVVDDTIHFLSKFNKARSEGASIQDAIVSSITTVGMALITTTFVFAGGFGVLWLSHYSANSDMGFMTATTILLAVIIDLIVLPALLLTLAGKKATLSAPVSEPSDVKHPVIPDGGTLGHVSHLFSGENGCTYSSAKQLCDQYGDVVQLNIFGSQWVFLSDMEMIHHILTDERDKFPKEGDVVDEMKAMIGDQGLLVTEGSQWLRQRQICMPAFRLDQLKSMMRDMNQVAVKACDGIKGQGEVDVAELTNRIGLAIICQVGFDYRMDVYGGTAKSNPILEAEDAFCQQLMIRLQRTKYWKKLPLPSNYKLDALIQTQRNILQEIIDTRDSNAAEATVLLDLFKNATSEEGDKLGDEELLQMVHNFVAAGHETSGALMMWMLYYLSTHPDLQQQIRDEIESVVGDREEIEYDDYKNLKLLEKVAKETLRIRPPIPIMVRSVGEDTVLGDYQLSKGAALMLMVGSVHTNTDEWGNNAHVFDPAHFDEDKVASRSRHAYLPFGAGPRICVGHRFSMMEACVVIAQLVRRNRFELIQGQNIKPFLKLVLGLKDGMKMKVTPITAVEQGGLS